MQKNKKKKNEESDASNTEILNEQIDPWLKSKEN